MNEQEQVSEGEKVPEMSAQEVEKLEEENPQPSGSGGPNVGQPNKAGSTFPRKRLAKGIEDAVLTKWLSDPQRMEKRMLTLVFLVHASDILESSFAPINDEEYEIAMERVRKLLDFEQESAKSSTTEILWAIFAAFTK